MERNGWLLVTIALVTLCQVASADINLADLNSTVTIQTGPSDNPFVSWTVDGVNYMYNQAFFYRIGVEGGERNLNTIGSMLVPPILPVETSSNPPGRLGSVLYANNILEIDVAFLLTGGSIGSRTADLDEVIRIYNKGTTNLDLQFFQFVNFNLSGAEGSSDVVTMTGTPVNTVRQIGTQGMVGEVVATPAPTHYQVALGGACSFGFPLLGMCSDSLPTNLTDDPGTLEGNVAWAFQWDLTLAPGERYIISKDKSLTVLVPEPASILGLGTVLFLLGSRLRRKRAQ